MTPGNLLLLDSNILLAATNSGRDQHASARRLFTACREAGLHLAVCGQVLREYLVVCTRPVSGNGFGMGQQHAVQNMRWFHGQALFLEETADVFQAFTRIVEEFQVHGKRMHDASIAAVCVTHSVDLLVTLNPADFSFHPGVSTSSPVDLLQQLTER